GEAEDALVQTLQRGALPTRAQVPKLHGAVYVTCGQGLAAGVEGDTPDLAGVAAQRADLPPRGAGPEPNHRIITGSCQGWPVGGDGQGKDGSRWTQSGGLPTGGQVPTLYPPR